MIPTLEAAAWMGEPRNRYDHGMVPIGSWPYKVSVFVLPLSLIFSASAPNWLGKGKKQCTSSSESHWGGLGFSLICMILNVYLLEEWNGTCFLPSTQLFLTLQKKKKWFPGPFSPRESGGWHSFCFWRRLIIHQPIHGQIAAYFLLFTQS